MCPGWVAQDEVDHDVLYLQCSQGDAGNYNNGSNYFNYLISDMNNTMRIDEDNIEKIRGDYIDKNIINTSQIYLYDYDIRWTPKLIMEAVGTDYELTEPIEYHFDFPVGTNRIEMEVANSTNFELSIDENEDIYTVSIQQLDDNKIYIDLLCRQNTNVTLHVSRKADELTTIHKIVLKRVFGAVEIDSNEVYLKEGSYIVTFKGEEINEAQIEFEGDGISVLELTNGKIESRYQIDISNAQTIRYEVTGTSIVDKVFYENVDLLDEHAYSESEYFWNL